MMKYSRAEPPQQDDKTSLRSSFFLSSVVAGSISLVVSNSATRMKRMMKKRIFFLASFILAVCVIVQLVFVQQGNLPPYQLTLGKLKTTQLRPPLSFTSVFGETDDLRIGKSCLYQHKKWICRDCGGVKNGTINDFTGRKYEDYFLCPKLSRRGKCPHFKTEGWDDYKPRSSSTYQSQFTQGTTRTLTRFGIGKKIKEKYTQAQCSLIPSTTSTSSKPCFNLNKCQKKNKNTTHASSSQNIMDLPMKIFSYGVTTTQLLNRIMEKHALQDTINITSDPNNACLYFASSKEDSIAAMKSDYWNHGQNHFMVQIHGGDQVFRREEQYEMAALMSSRMTDQHLRPGYDIASPLKIKWKLPSHAIDLDIHRPRKYLLSFRGSIQNSLQPYYQHRWLAAEYWWGEQDVTVDVQCKYLGLLGKKELRQPYDNVSEEIYSDTLLNSTFIFCPGGSGVSSYRFGEVLQAGGIPVLVPGTIPPLHPEIDWGECVVTVSETRIIDLPRLLRGMSREDITKRQTECQRLFHLTMKDPDDTHTVALLLWVERIQGAIDFRNGIDRLNNLFIKGNLVT